jgi:uncharacterized protein
VEDLEEHGCIFLRLEPGEMIISSLKDVARRRNLRVGAIISGVGMLNGIELGFFNSENEDYDRFRMTGIFDLSSIQGNITWRDGEPVPHVHMTFNDADMKTFSGHVMEAETHITMEVFIQRLDDLRLRRVKVPNIPATRISRQR